MDEKVLADVFEPDFDPEMTRIYVFRKGEQIFWYDAWFGLTKGDRIFHQGLGTLKVKTVTVFTHNPNILEVEVK